MPTYEYVCKEGHKFDKIVKMDDRNKPLECPECGSTANMVVSAVMSKLDGTDPSMPGAYLKWSRDREKRSRGKNG